MAKPITADMRIADQFKISPSWRQAEGETDGQPVLIRVRNDIEAAVGAEGLPVCMQLTVSFPEEVNCTALDEEQAGFIEEFETIVIDEIEEKGLALCCLVYNIQNQIDYTFYGKDVEAFIAHVSEYDFDGVELSVASEEEPDWSSYRDMYQGIIDGADADAADSAE